MVAILQPNSTAPAKDGRSAMNCPFCGVETEVPHDTQQACIQALQAEIVRVRSLLDHSRPLEKGPPAVGNDESVFPSPSPRDTPSRTNHE